MLPNQNYRYQFDLSYALPPYYPQSPTNALDLEKLQAHFILLMEREDRMMKEVISLKSELLSLRKDMNETISTAIKEEISKFMEKT